MDQDGDKVNKLAKKNEANIKPSWLNKLGQWGIHYMAFAEMFLAGHSGSSQANKDNCIFPAPVGNHSVRFDASCLLKELPNNNPAYNDL